MFDVIVLCLMDSSRLTNDDCALIWQSFKGKHESFRKHIFDAIAEIVDCANNEQVVEFWRLISSTPAEEIDSHFVSFVATFTEHALKRALNHRNNVNNEYVRKQDQVLLYMFYWIAIEKKKN